ncbi:hypothetical protein [Aridibaculum aurantiacum]|uniref:hypothetical protein n=1 Tax=Aridibaculum aurantiacum TaxID=2810307 RepID=UPI001A96F909|nr:hypothetical protein [Aridibaculum aurantiacum]
MVYDFVITLKRPDYRLADQVSQLMYVFAIVVFSYFFYLHRQAGIAYLVAAVLIAIIWIWKRFEKRIDKLAYYRLGLFIAALAWIGIGPESNFWMFGLYVVAGLLEKQVKFPQEIGFSKEEIAFNSFPKKQTIQWSELNNVVLKDGLITIDHKSNKLVQKEVDEDVLPELEAEFNQYCREQLDKDAVSINQGE